MAPKIKLTYFNIKGRAEAIRQAFYIGGVEFEDQRIAFQEWKELKPTTPFGSLPMLEVDGEVYTQSNAILRYAGKLSGLYSCCPVEALKIDGVLDVVEEINTGMSTTIRLPAEEKIPAREKLIACDGSGKVTTLLTNLNKMVAKNGKYGFSVGGKLTIADLVLTRLVENYMSGILDGVPTTYMQQFQNLVQVLTNTHANPAVHDWNVKNNLPKLKITYFNGPGGAEPLRLALAYAGIEFEDERLTREEFMKLKPSLPYGSVPVMTIGDKVVPQSSALKLYVGKLTGTYPQDPELALVVDEVHGVLADVAEQMNPTFFLPDGPEKLSARAELVKPDSKFTQFLTKLDKRLGEFNANTKGFLLGGNAPTMGDFAIYSIGKMLKSGFLDGIPTTLLDGFENIVGIYNSVDKLDAVVAWYAKQKK